MKKYFSFFSSLSCHQNFKGVEATPESHRAPLCLKIRKIQAAEKMRMAGRLRQETTVTLKWIAQRLQMGTWTNLNHHLYWAKRHQA
jgi:hypothetical protein